MKILFVSSPIVSEYGLPEPHVPLGLLSLATVLRQSGIEAGIMDSNVVDPDPLFQEVADAIMATDPDVVGFTTICHSYHTVLRLARQCKEIKPDVQVIFGGPQASQVGPETVGRFPQVDLVVRGECEQTIVGLIRALPSRQALRGLPGLTFRDGDHLIHNPSPEPLKDLNSLPLPDYGLIPGIESMDLAALPLKALPIEIGRGCPYQCTFCATRNFFNRVLIRSPESLGYLLKNINKDFGIQRFAFVHDLFAVSRPWLLEFFQILDRQNLNINWCCTTRSDQLDEELVEKMAAAGCCRVAVGVETGSPRMQRLIRKNLQVDQVAHVACLIKNHQMDFMASFIVGFPEETLEDLVRTIELRTALRYEQPTRVKQVKLFLLVPFKGSQLYDEKGDSLALDEFCSWSSAVTEDDKILIRDYPDIFFALYHFPTPYVRRDILVRAVFLLNNLDHLIYTLFIFWQDPALGFPQSLLTSPHLLELPGEQGLTEFGELASLHCTCHFLKKVVLELGFPDHPILEVMKYELALEEVLSGEETKAKLVKDFSYDVIDLVETIKAEKFRQLPREMKKLPHSIYFFKQDEQVRTAKSNLFQTFDQYLEAWSRGGKPGSGQAEPLID